MARGWESKSVEAQQEEARESSTQKRRALTPEQAARTREVKGLKMSRQRITEQLGGTQDPRRRAMLEQALRDVEERIREMEGA